MSMGSAMPRMIIIALIERDESKVKKQIDVGSTVTARLHNERVVVARVTAIVDSVAGRKVHITFGAFAFKVDETQILRVAANIS